MDELRARPPARVVHVLGQLTHGGAELRTLELARELRARGHVVDFATLAGRPGPLGDQARAEGAVVLPVRLGLRGAFRLWRAFRRYDVVHSHVQYFSGPVLALARLAGVRLRVASMHVTGTVADADLRRRAQHALTRRLLLNSATDVLCVSQGVRDSALPPRVRVPVRVTYNPVWPRPTPSAAQCRAGLERELGLPAGVPLLLSVANLHPAKNHPRLLTILAAAREQAPDAVLLCVGRGPAGYERDLLRQARELGLTAGVHFLGSRDDVPELMRAADVLVHPSRYEGLPGVVQEAHLYTLPVVASDLPGCLELARLLPGTVCLPLAQPDHVWARHALAAARAARAADRGREPTLPVELDPAELLDEIDRLYRGIREQA